MLTPNQHHLRLRYTKPSPLYVLVTYPRLQGKVTALGIILPNLQSSATRTTPDLLFATASQSSDAMATLIFSPLHACSAAPTLPSTSPVIRALNVSSIQYVQPCVNKFGTNISELSSRNSRQSKISGRKFVSRTPIVTASFENHGILDSKSTSPPPLFDGTTRLYFSSRCPYAQRVWIAVKYKGLDDVECVEISLSDKPVWYKEKVYPAGKVPALEHDGKVIGESMDLLYYLDEHFEGPKLAPVGGNKKQAATELLEYNDTFNKVGFTGLSMKDSTPDEISKVVAPAFDYLENALAKFSSDGPFLLGNFGLVDIAYAPFIERFELAFGEIRHLDIKAGRPKLAEWIEAMDKVEAYSSTKVERSALLELYKRMLDNDYFKRVGIVSDQSNAGGTPVAVN
ncbi:hypothetical protein KC19_4G232200 [Ceratodon purpureus]|uniref:GST N-terminal domain-containing protein n=1 Tax=Ceratodon purpureus TaxID=3225 RepID=A0A8T0IFC1_CERPU|nr:hypothetical protein KC19_4G232200 [Ceratodon purpureus]KAG0581204.1 hypothetical protein KC19_4G232200 [Ceratodon purpureus]